MEVSIETQKQKEKFRPFKLVIDVQKLSEAKNLYHLFNNRYINMTYNTEGIWKILDTIKPNLYNNKLYNKKFNKLKKLMNQ